MVKESKKRVDLCICTRLLFTHCHCIWLFPTPWTVAPPVSFVHGILQARILEWVAYVYVYVCLWASQVVLMLKNPPANARDELGSIPRSGRSPGGGHGNSLQCSCLENPTDTGALQATVHRVAQTRTRLGQLGMNAGLHIYMHAYMCVYMYI